MPSAAPSPPSRPPRPPGSTAPCHDRYPLRRAGPSLRRDRRLTVTLQPGTGPGHRPEMAADPAAREAGTPPGQPSLRAAGRVPCPGSRPPAITWPGAGDRATPGPALAPGPGIPRLLTP